MLIAATEAETSGPKRQEKEEMMAGNGSAPAGLGALAPLARRLVWALPLWALLLGLSTLTHQPSYDADFSGYAEYVTTDQFLVSHLGASILGAALGIIGAISLVLLLAENRAGRLAFWGLMAFTIGQVLNSAVFGVAAFFQPAIGEAYLGGAETVAKTVNENVYGPDLFALVSVGVVLWVVGLIQLGRAMGRSGEVPRWAGRAFAIAAPGFGVVGFAFGAIQPVAALVLATTAAVAASRLREGSNSARRQASAVDPVPRRGPGSTRTPAMT